MQTLFSDLAPAARRSLAAMLKAFDRLVPSVPGKPAAAVDAELRQLRAARRRGGRRMGAR